jgi:hypothetical protein
LTGKGNRGNRTIRGHAGSIVSSQVSSNPELSISVDFRYGHAAAVPVNAATQSGAGV